MDSDKTHRCQLLIFQGIQDGQPRHILQSSPLPVIGDGEILARIRLCTICGSDIHTLSGRRLCPIPSVLGHEAVAEVVAVKGRDKDHLKCGDRVTFSIADSCGLCRNCSGNLPQKCYKLFKYGHSEYSSWTGFNGCYASHIVLRKGTSVVKIPDHVTDKAAAPINCALATMMNVISSVPEQSHNNDNTVVIQGAGTLGLYGCALFHDKGYKDVFCTDLSDTRLGLVTSFGGTPWNTSKVVDRKIIENSELTDSECLGATCVTDKPLDDDPKYHRTFPDDGTVDVVVEVCGVPAVIKDGIRLLRPGGIYILAGMVHPDSRFQITGQDIITKCLTIKGVYNYAPRHLRLAVDFLSRTAHEYPYEALVSEPINLKDYPEAFRLAEGQAFHRVAMKMNE